MKYVTLVETQDLTRDVMKIFHAIFKRNLHTTQVQFSETIHKLLL